MKPATRKALRDVSAVLIQTSDRLDDAVSADYINWTNLKKLFAGLIAQLVPVLLPFLLDMLDPPTPPAAK